MQMSYFRRPQLAGRNLTRSQFATVRGNLRRNDPDGSSSVPYFPAASAGQTLDITADGTDYEVTFTSNSFAQIIADINGTLTTDGQAFDAGGVIGIRAGVLGGAGSISITGGTGAAAVGFDLTAGSIFSTGGDLNSTPVNLTDGNPFNTAFPTKGENFQIESIQRIAGRLASNLDVLHADLMRGDVVMKKVVGWTLSNNGFVVNLPAGTQLFTGGTSSPSLTKSSTKEQLAGFFRIIDTATGQAAAPRVMGVVNGAPGAVPYPVTSPAADTASWAAADGNNILGIDVVKYGPQAISTIKEGRIVTCSGADFVGNGVLVGDYAEITGATNTDESNNNGFRWVVEQVINGQNLILRPMSQSELNQLGQSLGDNQPILELSDKASGAQVYGNLNIRTGMSWSKGSLILDQPLSSTGSYEVWVAEPLGLRLRRGEDIANHLALQFRSVASNLDNEPNEILSHPTITGSGTGTVTVGDFYARWHGRVILVKGVSYPAAGTSTFYVYWDEQTGTLKELLSTGVGTTFNGPQNPDPSASSVSTNGHLICRLVNFTTTITATAANRTGSTSKSVITCGWGGQFADLASAMEYVSDLANINSEGAAGIELNFGNYSHYEIVLLSDQTVSSQLQVPAPYVTVRGAQKGVRLILNTPNLPAFVLSSTAEFTIKDLTLRSTAAGVTVALARDNETFNLINCGNQNDGGGTIIASLFHSDGSGSLKIQDCNLSVSSGIMWGNGQNVTIIRSSIGRTTQAGVTAWQAFSSSNSAPSATRTSYNSVQILQSTFAGWDATVSTYASFLQDQSISVLIRDSVISCGAQSGAFYSIGLNLAGSNNMIDGCSIGSSSSPTQSAIVGGAGTVVLNSIIYGMPITSTAGAVMADVVRGCVVTCVDSFAATVNAGYGVSCINHCDDTTVTGPVAYGIWVDPSSAGARIDNCIVMTAPGANTTSLQCGIAPRRNTNVSNCYVKCSGVEAQISNLYAASSTSPFQTTGADMINISDCHVLLPQTGQIGIHLVQSYGYKITGCTIMPALGTTITTDTFGIYLEATSSVTIAGNQFPSPSPLPATHWVGIGMAQHTYTGPTYQSCASVDMTGNLIVADESIRLIHSDPSVTSGHNKHAFRLMSNDVAMITIPLPLYADNGVVVAAVGNRISGNVQIQENGTGDVIVEGNRVNGNVYSLITGSGTVQFNDNVVSGTLSQTSALNDYFQCSSMSGCVIEGSHSRVSGNGVADGYAAVSSCYFTQDADFFQVAGSGIVVNGGSKFMYTLMSGCFFTTSVTDETSLGLAEAVDMVFTACWLGSVTISNSSFIWRLIIDGCSVQGNASISCPTIITNSHCSGNLSILSTNTLEPSVVQGNGIGGLTLGAGGALLPKVLVTGNTIKQIVTSNVTELKFTDNICTPDDTGSIGFSMNLASGVNADVSGNHFSAALNTTSDWYKQVLTVSLSGTLTLRNNRFNAAVTVFTDMDALLIEGNRFDIQNSNGLALQGGFNIAKIQDNLFNSTFNTTANPSTEVPPILVFVNSITGTTPSNLLIAGNTVKLIFTASAGVGTVISHAGPTTYTQGMIQIGDCYKVQVIGNTFQIPQVLQNSVFTSYFWSYWALEFITVTSADIVINSNLVSQGTARLPISSQYTLVAGSGNVGKGAYLYQANSDYSLWPGGTGGVDAHF